MRRTRACMVQIVTCNKIDIPLFIVLFVKARLIKKELRTRCFSGL